MPAWGPLVYQKPGSAPAGCLRCLLLVMCTHPFAKEALTLHLARSEGHERYFGCNLMHRNVLASHHQHLMTEAPYGQRTAHPEVPIGLDFTGQKSECSVMPQDTRVGRRVVLDGLDVASLRRVWVQTFGEAPPHSLSRTFLRRVLAYERQCRTHGGHSAATRRALAAMANGTPKHSAPARSVSAGTHLVREWNGRTYQVEVLDNGYRFDGKTYPSLTTITKRITGTHWSGPRFFGLTPKRKA